MCLPPSRTLARNLPAVGWIELQSDGSVLTQTGVATAGGLLRDHLGHCVEVFVGIFSGVNGNKRGKFQESLLKYHVGKMWKGMASNSIDLM
ncbi:unnamed protein product [Linum trigynum]|uniref:RNase H type-1 domain-containing protein n=1 Tax=Linum trigynum TaxID=586398 RepID=A0AAV2C8I9_9ROSI